MLRIATRLGDELEALVHKTIGCCIAVHRELGPGLIEGAYHRAVAFELDAVGVPFEREKRVPIVYRGKCVYVHRLDLVVGAKIVLEIKAVDRLHPVHQAQTLSSLRAAGLPIALLINFNVPLLPHGIRRYVL
ncbi:MAG TPA: GxxExxY protein [Vicinamibacterales bacterium]|jgi:GxxExxY protein